MSDHQNDPKFDRNLKRKAVAIIGVVGSLWGILGAVILANPAAVSTVAPLAFMGGVSVTTSVVAIIGSE